MLYKKEKTKHVGFMIIPLWKITFNHITKMNGKRIIFTIFIKKRFDFILTSEIL